MFYVLALTWSTSSTALIIGWTSAVKESMAFLPVIATAFHNFMDSSLTLS